MWRIFPSPKEATNDDDTLLGKILCSEMLCSESDSKHKFYGIWWALLLGVLSARNIALCELKQ